MQVVHPGVFLHFSSRVFPCFRVKHLQRLYQAPPEPLVRTAVVYCNSDNEEGLAYKTCQRRHRRTILRHYGYLKAGHQLAHSDSNAFMLYVDGLDR